MGYRLLDGARRRDGASRIRQPQTRAFAGPLLSMQRAAGNRTVLGALRGSRAEAAADKVAESVAAGVAPTRTADSEQPSGSESGERLAPSLRGRLEALLGWDLRAARIHANAVAGRDAQRLGPGRSRGAATSSSPRGASIPTRARALACSATSWRTHANSRSGRRPGPLSRRRRTGALRPLTTRVCSRRSRICGSGRTARGSPRPSRTTCLRR
jgi:hypothetical protein